MKRVVGIGGIFFKSQDHDTMRAWYKKHLGLEFDAYGSVVFECPEDEEQRKKAQTVWSLFPVDTKYFGAGSAPFMINYRVDNLDALVEQLRSEGVAVEVNTENYDYGKFGWVTDPEGNRIELWEPATPFVTEGASSDTGQ